MHIISTEQLKNILTEGDAVLIDARGGVDAFARYSEGHMQGAHFVDLETELSEKTDNAANGGRHPLPDPEEFGAFLGTLGIEPSSTVVVYDDKNGAMAAARFWWMMKAVGHEKIYVVSGGLKAIDLAGFAITSDVPQAPRATTYHVKEWESRTVDADHISDISTQPKYLVIDVRENYRYKGESEPIDSVAGHIPGATNVPYLSNMDENGVFLPAEELKEKYAEILAGRDPEYVVVHCGSGVTACHTLLALAEAGLDGAGLYVGSWSEWSRNDRPIAIGDK